MKYQRTILAIVGLFTVMTGTVGYGNLFRSSATDYDEAFRMECHQIIDTAQLWYARPNIYDGGGGSFIGLDGSKLGLTDASNSLVWKGKSGTFYIENIRFHTFDLLAVKHNGDRLKIRNIGFDTRHTAKL